MRKILIIISVLLLCAKAFSAYDKWNEKLELNHAGSMVASGIDVVDVSRDLGYLMPIDIVAVVYGISIKDCARADLTIFSSRKFKYLDVNKKTVSMKVVRKVDDGYFLVPKTKKGLDYLINEFLRKKEVVINGVSITTNGFAKMYNSAEKQCKVLKAKIDNAL